MFGIFLRIPSNKLNLCILCTRSQSHSVPRLLWGSAPIMWGQVPARDSLDCPVHLWGLEGVGKFFIRGKNTQLFSFVTIMNLVGHTIKKEEKKNLTWIRSLYWYILYTPGRWNVRQREVIFFYSPAQNKADCSVSVCHWGFGTMWGMFFLQIGGHASTVRLCHESPSAHCLRRQTVAARWGSKSPSPAAAEFICFH